MATPNAGDVDGPLGTSRMNYPTAITADDAGVVTFFDSDSRKFKSIAADAVHTVSTIGQAPNGLDKVWNMVHLGSAVYAIATDSVVTTVLKIDPATKTITSVLTGGGSSYPPVDSSATPLLGGIATDGTNLIISGKGYVWSLTLDGKLTLLAGAGENIDWPTADAKTTQPAMNLQLVSAKAASEAAVGSPDYITVHNGAIFVRGKGNATASYVTRIACP
jgi:hypothetical protein